MKFFRSPFFLRVFSPEAVWHGERTAKKIYLTFDDGPVAGTTGPILDVLSDLQVQATFFCVGDNIKRYPDIFNRMIEENHCIGNHTFHHLNGWKTGLQDYIRDIDQCDRTIFEHGYRPRVRLFRPPYGKISRKTCRALNPGYRIIMWDVMSYDFSDSVPVSRCLSASLRYSREGTIIVFHDSMKTRDKTRLVVYQYINYFLKKNYHFCKADELFLSNP